MRRTRAISNAVRFLMICLISRGEKRPFSPRSFSSASIYSRVDGHLFAVRNLETHLLLLELYPLHARLRILDSVCGGRNGLWRSWPGREIACKKKPISPWLWLHLPARSDYANKRPSTESGPHAFQELFRGLLQGRPQPPAHAEGSSTVQDR